MPDSFFYSLVAMNSLFAASAWCLSRPTMVSSTAVVTASIGWLILNGPIEGRVLVVLTPQNGITESDLLSVVGVGIGLVGFARAARTRRGPQRRAA